KEQAEKEEWLPLHALPKEKPALKKELTITPTFKRLKEIIKKPTQALQKPEASAFEKLKKLKPQERKKFMLLKRKKLNKEETEQLLKKLRQTATGKKK
ncbi:hypothetical protein HY485_01930, partial [Candidatus Woesearchaeota archaeon]|nr:hypothetical protein [Candidatus Woesearchaeota archaeon]